MLREVLIGFVSTSRVAYGGVFSFCERISAGARIPGKAAVHILFDFRLTFGRNPEPEKLARGWTLRPFEHMDPLWEIERVRVRKIYANGRAILDHAQGSIVVDAAEQRVFPARQSF